MIQPSVWKKAGAVFVLCAAAQAQTFTVLYSFAGSPDGAYPRSGLILDSTGDLYGATQVGGVITPECSTGCGTIFKLDTSGQETVLYSFTGGTDGQTPNGGLIRDSAGNLYGTTSNGGSSSYGTVFRINGTQETVLHTFIGIDGADPGAGLIRDAAGNLYGTTILGGTGSAGSCSFGCGTVFKLSKAGRETVLHSFNGYPTDGGEPAAGLIGYAAEGYGTTAEGGTSNYGTVYKISASGQETLVHSFSGMNGSYPIGGLIRDAAGNLYGTAFVGGIVTPQCTSGCGVVFKIAP